MTQITGFRAWAIRQDGDGLWLASPLQGTKWPQTGLYARCSCSHGDITRCEGECGIRIWKRREDAMREAQHASISIIGEAVAMGRVSEYERAYLAQFSRVISLDWDSLRGIDREIAAALQVYLPAE